MFAFLSSRKNIVGTQKRVRISYGNRAIGVRVTEILLYMEIPLHSTSTWARIRTRSSHPFRLYNKFRSSCACAKYHPGFCSAFLHSIVSIYSFGRLWFGLTARMRSHSWSFTGCICPKRMVRPIYCTIDDTYRCNSKNGLPPRTTTK